MSGEKNSFDNFEELYTNCYWLVYRYVRHMIEKDLAAAEDVTQEVFLVAYQKWQEVRRHPNQKGFLLLTAKNKLKKWYEQQGKIQIEGPGQEEKAARRPDSGQEGYYVQAEWNAFLEQIFSMQELLIWKFIMKTDFPARRLGKRLEYRKATQKSSCSECDKN